MLGKYRRAPLEPRLPYPANPPPIGRQGGRSHVWRRSRAGSLELAPRLRLGEAIAATLNNRGQQVLDNVAGARLRRDPESLHQLRVGLRRLRTALSLYRDAIPSSRRKALNGKLRELVHEVGSARDWDVLIAELHRTSSSGRNPGNFEQLHTAAHLRRAESYRQVRTILSKPGIPPYGANRAFGPLGCSRRCA